MNLRPLRSFEGVKSLYQNIDLTIVRENTEGLYIGIEKQVDEGRAEATKVITKKASDRIVKYAFEYAKANGKKKVTAIHKANIMKLTDGLFLNCARGFSIILITLNYVAFHRRMQYLQNVA